MKFSWDSDCQFPVPYSSSRLPLNNNDWQFYWVGDMRHFPFYPCPLWPRFKHSWIVTSCSNKRTLRRPVTRSYWAGNTSLSNTVPWPYYIRTVPDVDKDASHRYRDILQHHIFTQACPGIDRLFSLVFTSILTSINTYVFCAYMRIYLPDTRLYKAHRLRDLA